MPEPLTALRADKFLHHVRLYKTRSLATQACERGKITLAGQAIKPARDLRPGDRLMLKREDVEMLIEVLALPPARVGAPVVAQFMRDHTPSEDYVRAAEIRRERALITPKLRPHDELTRPSKKDLREIRKLMGRE